MKNAAYALPDTSSALEDFTWLRQEIIDAGGGALLLRAEALGAADAEIIALFRQEREEDYRKLLEDVATFTAGLPDLLTDSASGERALRQLQTRLEAIRALDFFPGAVSAQAEAALERAAAAHSRQRDPEAQPAGPKLLGEMGQHWVTRAGVYVDRLACAWIILRFVDAEARFTFVAPDEPLPGGAIPFDMAGVEFGHHGTCCSAETLAAHVGPENPALRAVAEVVHDLDLKENSFGRPEAPGLKRLLDGICAVTRDDAERVRLACPVFDALYHGFSSPHVDER